MRNFSMKKFGTPIRAAPGVASETVGLSRVGDPSVLRVGFERSTRFLARSGVACSSVPLRASEFGLTAPSSPTIGVFSSPFEPLPLSVPEGCVLSPSEAWSSPCCCWSGCSCAGAGTSGVAVTVGTAVGTGVAVAATPRSVIDCTGAGRPGIWSEPTEAPGGTSTVIVSVCPVTSVTETRCSSAEAGTTTTPNSAAAASAMTTGFRRLIE